MTAGVRMNLRAVKRHHTELEHAHLARQQQNLYEQRLDVLEESPPEGDDGAVIRMIVRRDEAESDRIVSRPLQFPAGEVARRHSRQPEDPTAASVIAGRTCAAIAVAHRGDAKASMTSSTTAPNASSAAARQPRAAAGMNCGGGKQRKLPSALAPNQADRLKQACRVPSLSVRSRQAASFAEALRYSTRPSMRLRRS